MSEERRLSDELNDDVQSTTEAVKKAAQAPKKAKQAVDNAKKTAKVAKKAGKAAAKAGKAAAKAGAKFLQAIGKLIVATFPWSLLVILIILLIIVVLYMIFNNPIFNILVKLFQGPSVDDIREYIQNTQNDPDDWRFAYNKMLPEEQYAYIYFGNHPSKTGEGKEVSGLADYIIKAYEDARKAFEQDLGDIEAYHDTYFNAGGSTLTIDDVYPHAVKSEDGSADDLWNEDQINADLGGTRVIDTHEEWFESPHTTASGVYVRSKMQKYIKKLKSTKGLSKYKGGYFDYLVMKEPEEGQILPTMVRRLTLNLDLTYLANHDTLVGDLDQALDGKIVKESELTNVVTYLIAGMNVATCDISPSKGYLDFLKKTIGNPDVFNPSNKFKGKTTIPGILGAIISGADDIKEYSLYTSAKVKFKYNGKVKTERMGILDTTACEVVVLEGTKAPYTGKYGEEVYQYYIVLKNPVDTDRLLWAMFVSDAAKTVTYKGIFNKVAQAYQGSYYDMYSIFEPLNAEIEENFFLRFFSSWSASDLPALAFAKYADAEEIRKYLYGLSQEEVEKGSKYFQKLWDAAEKKDKKYKQMLTDYYLVDKNQDGEITYEDYTGLLNETYYTFHMRPLYKCDASWDITQKHNAAHDGYGVNNAEDCQEKCLKHRLFPSSEECDACLRKNGGYECSCELGGVNCVEWASDWPPECPDCGKFAQRALHGKVKVEYVRDPKPEFATLITISEEEYKEKIDVDIGSSLAAVKGNGKVDLTTNYNRYGYGDNYDPSFETEHYTKKPEESAFHESDGKKKYFFSVYEFYGEYALGEKWERPETNQQNFHEGNSDLIVFNPDESRLKEFESMQEISEMYNREQWNKWAAAMSDPEKEKIPANYRAVSILSALYKRKYYYHNLLNSDSYEAGMFDEENGYERPVASRDYDPENPGAYKEEFDKNFTSNDEDDTAYYGRNLDGFEEDKVSVGGYENQPGASDGDIEFERSDPANSYFTCPNCNGEVAVSNSQIEEADDNESSISITCPHCSAIYVYSDSEISPGIGPIQPPPIPPYY